MRGGALAHLTVWAVLAAASPSFAEPLPEPSAPTADLAAVKAEFANAQKLFKMGKFAEALPLFRSLAETTRSPNARLYLGHCLQHLGKYVDAYKTFAAVVKEISEHPEEKYEPTREAAIAELAVLNMRVAKVVISVIDIPPDVAVTLDGVAVDEKDLGSSIVVQPGSHRVEVSAGGVAPIRREVRVDGGDLKTLTVSLKKTDEGRPVVAAPPRPATSASSEGTTTARTVGYVAGGIGVAGLAVFAISGLMAKNTFNDLQAECAHGCADAGHLGDIDHGKSLQRTANMGLVVGLIGLGAGTTLFILGGHKGNDGGASVAIAGGRGMVSYTGRF